MVQGVQAGHQRQQAHLLRVSRRSSALRSRLESDCQLVASCVSSQSCRMPLQTWSVTLSAA